MQARARRGRSDGHAFPELKANPQRIVDLIREEEESFIRTLDRGIALFEEAAANAKAAGRSAISGDDAFKLHDTYGFPIDLTEIMARERGMTVDAAEYERLMEEAKERARSAESNTRCSRLRPTSPARDRRRAEIRRRNVQGERARLGDRQRL